MAVWTRRAQKDLGELPERLQEQARALVRLVDEKPSIGHKLKGRLEGLRSVRLGRSYRIVYEVRETGVAVFTVRHRKDAYR